MPYGLYLSDIHLKDENLRLYAVRWFRRNLERFTSGSIDFHYQDVDACAQALSQAGFAQQELIRPSESGVTRPGPRSLGEDIVRVIAAETPPVRR